MPAFTTYLDFDLLIEPDEDGYQSRVIASPGGQATSSFQMPFSALELENFLLRVGLSLGEIRRRVRRIDTSEMSEVKSFGGRLFGALFDDRLAPLLQRSIDEARRRDAGLRLRIRLADAPELADLPWEYLYDVGANRFLNLSVATPLVRYLELPEPGSPLSVTPPLRVLVMISGPSDVPALDVEAEWGRITSAFTDLEERGLVTVERLATASLASLQVALRRGTYHVLHFVGHGGYDASTQDGVIVLEGLDGRARPVSAQDLGTLLHDHRTLRLVVLNSCEGARSSPTDPFAGAAQSLVRQGIPAVIAMQFEITDHAAVTLAHEFYSALADGYPVDAALGEARKAVFATGNEVEWGTPVLYMRAPDGVIFRVSDDEARTGDGRPLGVTTPAPTADGGPVARRDVGPLEPEVVAVEAPVDTATPPTGRNDVPDPQPSDRAGAEPARPEPSAAGPSGPLGVRLGLLGAAVTLVGVAFPEWAVPDWFVVVPLVAVAVTVVVALSSLRGEPLPWGGGALVGLGIGTIVQSVPFVAPGDDVVQGGRVAGVVGALLLVASGVLDWRASPREDGSSADWRAAFGAVLVAAGALLPVTNSEGPVSLSEMAEWNGLGGPMSIYLPLVIVAAVLFVVTLFPTSRPGQQAGLMAGIGLHLCAFFVALGLTVLVSAGYGTGVGTWVGLAGAVLVVATTGKRLRRRHGPRDRAAVPAPPAG